MGFHSNHLIPTPKGFTCKVLKSWPHGKGCCHHVEHAWAVHVGGNSRHLEAWGWGFGCLQGTCKCDTWGPKVKVKTCVACILHHVVHLHASLLGGHAPTSTKAHELPLLRDGHGHVTQVSMCMATIVIQANTRNFRMPCASPFGQWRLDGLPWCT